MKQPAPATNRFGRPAGFMQFLSLFLTAMMRPFAWCISRVKINRVTFSHVQGKDDGSTEGLDRRRTDGEVILKQRSALSVPLIFFGNVVFRFRSVPVAVLGFQEWVQWEQQIENATADKLSVTVCSSNSAGLRMPKIPGVPLSKVLQKMPQTEGKSRASHEDQALRILSQAAAALYRLHQTEVESDGRMYLLSHGDASATNLLLDETSDGLRWFDFDLRHDLTMPATDRHADDLRALLFTSHKCLPLEFRESLSLEQLADQMKTAYPDPQVWSVMQNIVTNRWFAFDLFHHAQMLRLK